MSAIRWTDTDAAGLTGWAMLRVSALFPARKAKSKRHTSSSDVPAHFSTIFQAPLRRRKDFQKAVELALPQLMPVAPEKLLIYARQTLAGVELAAFHKSEMEDWWKKLGTRKPNATVHISDEWSVLSPNAQKIASGRGISLLAAGVLSAMALVALYLVYQSSLQLQLSSLLKDEQRARSLAVSVARQREESNLWGLLEQAHASARLPGVVLAAVSELSRSTPTEAFWTRIEWSPTGITIGGTATDPVATLAALSSIKSATAAFSKPVTDRGGGRQDFEILLTPRGLPR